MIPRRRMRLYQGQLFDLFNRLLLSPLKQRDVIEAFEDALAKYIGARFVMVTSSGRQALQLLIEESDLPARGRIILPALTLRDLVVKIQEMGYHPVIVDIEESTLNMNPDKVDAVAKLGCAAIVATHMFGNPCKIMQIRDIAGKYGARLFEDCAHALGSKVNGFHVGTFGQGAIFSFETIKSINTFGGGCVVTNDERLAVRIRRKLSNLRVNHALLLKKSIVSIGIELFLRSPLYYPTNLLMNAKSIRNAVISRYLKLRNSIVPQPSLFSPVQASMGLKMLQYVDDMNDRCREIVNRYKEGIGPRLAFQEEEILGRSNRYYCVARLDRDTVALREASARNGVDLGIEDEIIDDCSVMFPDRPCPIVKKVFKCLIQLPCWYQMSNDEIDKVIDVFRKILYQEVFCNNRAYS